MSRAAKEGRLEERDEEGRVITIPEKLRNPLIGPYRMVAWAGKGKRKAVIDIDGKHETHSVKRLVKHHIWDDVHLDTNKAPRKKRGEKEMQENEEKEEKDEEVEKPLEIGDLVAYRIEDKTCPFGIGKLLEIENENDIIVQCYGYDNGKKDITTPGGLFRPQWVGKNDTHYARETPFNRANRPFTNFDALRTLTANEIICTGKTEKFLSKGRVSTSLRTRLDDEIGPLE